MYIFTASQKQMAAYGFLFIALQLLVPIYFCLDELSLALLNHDLFCHFDATVM
jgi:hypothetical protein